jgi:hypothetical protein
VEGWKRGKLFSLALFFYNYIVLEFDSGTKWSLAFFINSWLRKNFDGEFLSFFSYNFLYFLATFCKSNSYFLLNNKHFFKYISCLLDVFCKFWFFSYLTEVFS